LEFKGTNKLSRRSDIKDDKFNIGEIFIDNGAISAAYWEYIDFRIVILKVETKTTIERGLVIEVITLLNTAFITL